MASQRAWLCRNSIHSAYSIIGTVRCSGSRGLGSNPSVPTKKILIDFLKNFCYNKYVNKSDKPLNKNTSTTY